MRSDFHNMLICSPSDSFCIERFSVVPIPTACISRSFVLVVNGIVSIERVTVDRAVNTWLSSVCYEICFSL